MEKQRVIVDVEVDLHRRFKACCAVQGVAMRRIISDYIEQYVTEFEQQQKGGNKKK